MPSRKKSECPICAGFFGENRNLLMKTGKEIGALANKLPPFAEPCLGFCHGFGQKCSLSEYTLVAKTLILLRN